MVDWAPIATWGGLAILTIGCAITVLDKISKYKKDQEINRVATEKKIIDKIDSAISPLKTSLEGKQISINDLWVDLEKLEDHLNELQVKVARNTGVLDTQTPLINEVRAQIELLRAKIEAVSVGIK